MINRLRMNNRVRIEIFLTRTFSLAFKSEHEQRHYKDNDNNNDIKLTVLRLGGSSSLSEKKSWI